MAVAYTGISRLQDLSDVNITIGAGVDEYALCWDNDTSKFVLRQVAGVYLPLAGGTLTGALTVIPAATTTMSDNVIYSSGSFRGTTGGDCLVHRFIADYTPSNANTNVIFYGANVAATKAGTVAMGGSSAAIIGGMFKASQASTAAVGVPLAIGGDFWVACGSSSTPTLTNGIAGRFNVIASDPITNAYGVQITTPTGGQVTNSYGLYVQDHNVGATLNYAIYTNAGAVRFGDALTVIQDSGTGAVPVLTLRQDDDDQDMIEFTGTVGVGNAIEAVGGKTLTTTHFVKVTITGVGELHIPVGTIA